MLELFPIDFVLLTYRPHGIFCPFLHCWSSIVFQLLFFLCSFFTFLHFTSVYQLYSFPFYHWLICCLTFNFCYFFPVSIRWLQFICRISVFFLSSAVRCCCCCHLLLVLAFVGQTNVVIGISVFLFPAFYVQVCSSKMSNNSNNNNNKGQQ